MSDGDQLRPDSVVEPSLAVQWIPLDDEIVLFDPLRNKVYRFNGTGAFIWRCLERATTVAEIQRQVASEYRLDDGAAAEAIEAFLGELLDLGVAAAHVTAASDRDTHTTTSTEVHP